MSVIDADEIVSDVGDNGVLLDNVDVLISETLNDTVELDAADV